VLVEVEEKPPIWRSPIGARGRFLSIAILIAIGLTAVWVYVGRYFASQAHSADPDNAAQVAMGRTLYLEHCAYCHGQNREGLSAEARAGTAAPPLDHNGGTPKESDRALFELTKYGGQPFAKPGSKSQMPGYEFTLGDPQIWAVIAFLKNRWPESVREAQAQINAEAEAGGN
jgi:mono/diheme cytochrome c family protein